MQTGAVGRVRVDYLDREDSIDCGGGGDGGGVVQTNGRGSTKLPLKTNNC